MPALRLATYNIQKCIGMDLRRRPERIVRVLDRLGAQIVVLQEADKRLPPRPAALPGFVLEEAGWQIAPLGGAGSLGWHGNAVIWRGGGLSVVDTAHVSLPGLEPRGAVRVEFQSEHGPLRVIGCHLGLVAAWRRRQVLQLSRATRKLPARPTIWAGDFNEWSNGAILQRAAPHMRFLPPHASFPSPGPLGPLDRIALSDALETKGHGVFTDHPARMASDHLPVWVDLQPVDNGVTDKG